MAPPRLRVLVFPETGRNWTARALDHDIAVQGRSMDGAIDALAKIVRAHVAFDLRHNREPLSAFPPAPRLYWNAFRDATRLSPAQELEPPEVDGTPWIVMATAERNPAAYHRVWLSETA